ncbi:PREDICTED: larval cuticle protein LCP-22-like [Papilio polytes]|uniref:Cuticular protein PpolCPR38 n=1 Tax=Papilio polytes TaxID=76194 RepID=I4DLW7_PAPPL|nr:larval cuticle protein LCP-22-like precursor [Papilio polytes]BAM18907.1 cuticular protein PpolCPR38 [Papilio polytes]
MRAFVVAMAVLAVASAQTLTSSTPKPTYDNFGFPVQNRYNQYNQYNRYNRYQNQFNPYGQYQGQYQGNYQGQFQPYQYLNQNRYQSPTYKPFVFSTTAAPVVTAAPPAPSAAPSETSAAPAASPSAAPAPVPVFVPQSPVIAAKVVSSDGAASIVKYGNEINPDGAYNYYYETDNGIAAQAQGVPRNLGGNPPVTPDVVQGSFSWTSPEGEVISLTYVADENGYQPQGNAIPQPPEIPAQIARALEYTAKYHLIQKE